jgi:hypothetical protein
LKEVEKEGMHCHLHDPKRKCKGSTKKGAKCGGVTKKGEEYCWRHLGEKKSKVMVNDDYPSDYDSDLQYEEEVAPPKKSQKKKSKVISSDEEEVAPPKKSRKKKSKVISSDEDTSDEESSSGFSKEEIKWEQCRFDKRREYSTNFQIHYKYLLKERGGDKIVGLLFDIPDKHHFAYHRSHTITSGEKKILSEMGFTYDVEEIEKGSSDPNYESSSNEEEVAPPKKSQKKKSKVISSDEEEVISSKSPIRRRVTVETEDEM